MNKKILIVLLFVAFLAPIFAQVGKFELEKVLPSTTLAVAGTNNAAQLYQEFLNSKIWNLITDKEFKSFFDSFAEKPLEKIQQAKEQIQYMLNQKQTGINLDELYQVLGGELLLAVVEVGNGQPTVILSWDLGSQKENIEKTIKTLLQQMGKRGQATITNSFGYDISTIPGAKRGETISFVYIGTKIVISNSLEYLQKVLDPNYVLEDNLANSNQYVVSKKQVLQGYAGKFVYINTKAILEFVTQMFSGNPKFDQGKAIAELVGLDKIHAITLGASLRNGAVAESLFFFTPEGRTGLLGKALPNIVAPQNLIPYIPEKVIALEHGPLYLGQLYRDIMEFLKQVDKREYERALRDLEGVKQEFGMTVEEILDAVGNEYLLTVNCSGGFIPDIALQIAVQDTEKMQKFIDGLLGWVPEKMQYNVQYKGTSFTYFNFSSRREPIPLAPAFGMIGNRLVICPFPETFKNLIESKNGQLPEDLKLFLDNRDYSEVAYLNLKSLVVPLYKTILPLLQGMAPRSQVPFEPALLPPASLFEKYVSNCAIVSIYNANGILFEAHSPTGITWMIVGGAVAAKNMPRKHWKK